MKSIKIMTFHTQHCLNYVEPDNPVLAPIREKFKDAEVLEMVASDHFPHTAVIKISE